jgi:hypothetical protein
LCLPIAELAQAEEGSENRDRKFSMTKEMPQTADINKEKTICADADYGSRRS